MTARLLLVSSALLCISAATYEDPIIPTAPSIPVTPRQMKPGDRLHLVQVVGYSTLMSRKQRMSDSGVLRFGDMEIAHL